MKLLPYPCHGYTMADYRRIERETGRKHEFYAGDVYAMTGDSPLHAELAVRVIGQFLASLEGGPCRVYSSDLGVRSMVTGLATHADVTVVCGELVTDEEDAHTVLNPRVLVEVTSPSTERRDRGGKLAHYQTIESVDAVVIVSHWEARVMAIRRLPVISMDAAYWEHREARSPERLEVLDGLTLDVGRLYAGLKLGGMGVAP